MAYDPVKISPADKFVSEYDAQIRLINTADDSILFLKRILKLESFMWASVKDSGDYMDAKDALNSLQSTNAEAYANALYKLLQIEADKAGLIGGGGVRIIYKAEDDANKAMEDANGLDV
jgi:hypothetical protein